jgi:hypothetical protein
VIAKQGRQADKAVGPACSCYVPNTSTLVLLS